MSEGHGRDPHPPWNSRFWCSSLYMCLTKYTWFKVVPYTSGKIWSVRLIFLFFLAVCLNISTVINIKILANSNQLIQSYKFTSHIAAFLSVVLITDMLEICIQTSYDQNVQLILKSYLPVVYGTTLIWLSWHELSLHQSNSIGGVVVSMFVLSAVIHGFKPRWSQTLKDYQMVICICCFFAKHTTLRRKNKYWLAHNQDILSKWSDMSTRLLLLQSASTKATLTCWI